MKILVTGGNGQLGQCISEEISNHQRKDDFIFLDHHSFDITNELQVCQYLDHNDVECIINCAAYTDVDGSESNYEMAYKVNVMGSCVLSYQAFKRGISLIHISTDFVTPKHNNKPLKPNSSILVDKIPNSYGRTKYIGETEIIQNHRRCKRYGNYKIVRTSWLYSEYGKNFVKTMLGKIQNGSECKVVDDQIGTPTYARDLAVFLIELSINCSKWGDDNRIIHFSNTGAISWFDFAKEIQRIYNVETGNISNLIFPCSSSQFTRPAKRQHYSVLDKRDTEEIISKYGFTKLAYWQESLEKCMVNLTKKGED